MTFLRKRIISWLTKEEEHTGVPLCNFERFRAELRPCDVILVEGRSRVSNIIKRLTQSTWTHSALYIGRKNQIDASLLEKYSDYLSQYHENEQLIIETELGRGTLVHPLSFYKEHHLRICRPKALSQWDAVKVLQFTLHRLGNEYNVRQLLDLGRLLLPYTIIPRKLGSSLFNHKTGEDTRDVCSSMLALAFMSVNFPILPIIQRNENGDLKLYKRNFQLFTPKDFDLSPYFEIIKYPLIGHDDLANYRNLPWDTEGFLYNDEGDCINPITQDDKSWCFLINYWREAKEKLHRLWFWPFTLPSWSLDKAYFPEFFSRKSETAEEEEQDNVDDTIDSSNSITNSDYPVAEETLTN